MLGKIAMGGAWRLQTIVATPMPMASRGVMTVEPQDLFIADLDTDGGAATAFSLNPQKAQGPHVESDLSVCRERDVYGVAAIGLARELGRHQSTPFTHSLR